MSLNAFKCFIIQKSWFSSIIFDIDQIKIYLQRCTDSSDAYMPPLSASKRYSMHVLVQFKKNGYNSEHIWSYQDKCLLLQHAMG